MASTASGGKIVWTLDADSSKLDASLTKAQVGAKKTASELTKAGIAGQTAATKLGSSFTASLTTIQGKLSGVTAGMERFAIKALGVGAAVGGLVYAGVKSAAAFEDLENVLFNLTGDSDQAADALERLFQLNLDTAHLSTQGLVEASKDLTVVYGSANKAFDALDPLAKVISAAGGGDQDLLQVSSALQRVAISGKAGTRQMVALFDSAPQLKKLATSMGLTAESLENAADPIQVISDALRKSAADPTTIEALKRQNGSFNDMMADFTDTLNKRLGEWAKSSGIFDILKKALDDLLIWLEANGPRIGESIKNAVAWVIDNKGAIIGAVKAFAAVWATLKITTTLISLVLFFEKLGKAIAFLKGLSIIAPIIKVLTTNVTILTTIGRALTAVLAGLTLTVGLVIAAILVWGYNIIQIVTHWRDFWDLLVSFGTWLAGFITQLYQAGLAIVQGLIQGIKDGAVALWQGIQAAADQIGAFFSGAAGWLYDTGKAIIQGLVNGIKDMAGTVKDTVGGIGNSITNKFKGILGIGSPSKVFAGLGENVVQGLQQGLQVGVGDVNASVTGMANTMTQQPLATGNLNVAPQGTANSSVVNIGTINIAKEVDGEKWLQRLNRNTELAGQGMVGATNG